MATNGGSDILRDGTVDFSGGVSADNNKTIASPVVPYGVPRNAVSWSINCTTRGGALGQRPGNTPLIQGAPWPKINYQGGLLYQPDFSDPFLLLLINGHLWKARVDTDNSVSDLSAFYGPTLPVTEKAYFEQAEMFAVIQCGDLTTNPLFYTSGIEGIPTRPEVLRSSLGFISVGNVANEIPPAGPMDYWANRLWYAFGRQYCAADIVSNLSSGHAGYDYRDSVLHVTENPVAKGGDGFTVPTMAGDIRALSHTSNIDTSLGQSPLFVFTRRSVYTCEAPVTRADWTAADNDHQPLQKLLLAQGGTYSDRSVVAVNSDLFFQSPPNGDIRSVAVSVRNDRDWGNVPLSRNVNRALVQNDRSMMRFATGIQFDNRLHQATLPILTPAGVAFQGILPLNFDVISTLEEKRPPAWEGISQGLFTLQLFEGDFGGRQRAFAVVWSAINSAIEVWEITSDNRFDGGNAQNRVTRVVETAAYNAGQPFTLKELETCELWIDGILGTVDFEVWYRPDAWSCWVPWHAFQICAAKDCRELTDNPCDDLGYPEEPFCEQDRTTLMMPKPKPECINSNNRPSTWGYQFQIKLRLRGWCRIRGILLHMLPRYKEPFLKIPCAPPINIRQVTDRAGTPVVPTPPVVPDPDPVLFHNVAQSVCCPTGTLHVTDALPPGFSVDGNCVIIMAGYNTYTAEEGGQATADAAALATLQVFFDTGVTSGLFVCETPLPDPPFLSNCGVWLKPDDVLYTGLADNTPIGGTGLEWTDRVHIGRLASQTDAAKRPLYKTNIFGTRPGIRFDGTDDWLDFNINPTYTDAGGAEFQACTVFILHQLAVANNNGILLAQGSRFQTVLHARGSANTWFCYDGIGTLGESVGLSSAATVPKVMIFRNQLGVPGNFFRENHTNVGPINYSNLGFEFGAIGESSSGQRLAGDLGDILIYCGRLTDDQCDEVMDWYRLKYPGVLPA